MSYRVFIRPRAQKQLSDVPTHVYDRIKRAVLDLAADPRPTDSRKLVSREGWRIRVGDYRVLYTIDDHERTVTIQFVGHRRDVYR